MPRSENSSRALATISSSWKRPIAVKTGVAWAVVIAGLAVWATTQMEQEAASVWVGWTCVDSAAAVHSIRDSAIHAEHRIHKRIVKAVGSCFEIRLVLAYNGYLA
jgi:hypothetical protein